MRSFIDKQILTVVPTIDHVIRKRPGDDLLFSYRQLSMLIGFDKFLPISVDFYRTSFQLDGRSGSRSS